jgi:1-acyl-sn-glycerol-3-phosphate acyltransferase
LPRRREPWYRLAESVLIPPLTVWFRWRFEGLEHVPAEGPVLVAANHISHFDPLAHALFLEKAGRRPRFVAKIELYRNPLLRRVLRGARQIPVRRGSGDPAPVEAALRSLREGEVVMIYPEGTVTKNRDLTPMAAKTGIARLTLASEVPVMPLAVWGTQFVERLGRKSFRPGILVWVKGGAPLDFSEHEENREDPEVLRKVTDAVMSELALLVDDLRARYPRR